MGDGERPNTDTDVNTGADADVDTDGDAEEADWEMAPNSDTGFPADPERVAFLCKIADDIYGESSESRRVSATLYRVSDLYSPDGDTSPEEIYLNVHHTMNIKVQDDIGR